MGAIKVAVFDDHPLFREGVIESLRRQGDIDIVGEGGSGKEAVTAAIEKSPDVILLDLNMPGGGTAAVASIVAAAPTVKVLLLTADSSEDEVFAVMQSGASGYTLKGVGGAELASIIRVLYHGDTYIAPTLAARLLTRLNGKQAQPTADRKSPWADLSAREEQILGHIAQGMSNKEIAATLSLSDKTVKHYTTNILQKLHVRNRVEAALLAVRSSLASPEVALRRSLHP